MNKEELVQEVSKKAKVTQKEAADIINSFWILYKKLLLKVKKLL